MRIQVQSGDQLTSAILRAMISGGNIDMGIGPGLGMQKIAQNKFYIWLSERVQDMWIGSVCLPPIISVDPETEEIKEV